MRPTVLAEHCILLGSAIGVTVLNPFFRFGIMGLAAVQNGRHATFIEISTAYAQLIQYCLP
jgi:DNA modification methylase